jgi:hypothetical protein
MNDCSVTKTLRFLITDLGKDKVILGYPWLMGFEPVFHWRDATLDEAFQPVVVSSLGLKHLPSPDVSIRLAREDDCKCSHIPDVPVRRQSNDNHEYIAACSVAQSSIPVYPIPLDSIMAEEDWEHVVEEDICPHTFLHTTASDLAQKAADKTAHSKKWYCPNTIVIAEYSAKKSHTDFPRHEYGITP